MQEASSVLSEYPDLPGELVILSDGRPADTKVALTFFQDPESPFIPPLLKEFALSSTGILSII